MRSSIALSVVHFFLIHFCNGENSNGITGIGSRPIENILSSNDRNNDFTTVQKTVSSGDPLSADDLFLELSDIWRLKEDINTDVIHNDDNNKLKDGNSQGKNDPNLISDITTEIVSNEMADELGSDNPVVENRWLRLKGIIEKLKSILFQMYGNEIPSKDEKMFNMIDRLMEIGDSIYMIRTIGSNLDEELLVFLRDKWLSVVGNLYQEYPSIASVLAVDVDGFFMGAAKELAKKLGNKLGKQAFVHRDKQDFILQTMRSSGFKDPEIHDVFVMLNLPTDVLLATSKTLNETAEEGRSFGGSISRTKGYGHGGGHGHGGGYGYEMMTKDPFLLLAGLALATFAAYILYRLLTTTMMAKRSASNEFLSLELSDLPNTMAAIYSWLEKAEILYGTLEKNADVNQRERFTRSINQLWRSYEADKISRSCIRRYLCHHVNENIFNSYSSGINLEQLFLIGLAELLGERHAGIVLDQQIEKLISGDKLTCKAKDTDSCSENKFSSILNS